MSPIGATDMDFGVVVSKLAPVHTRKCSI